MGGVKYFQLVTFYDALRLEEKYSEQMFGVTYRFSNKLSDN